MRDEWRVPSRLVADRRFLLGACALGPGSSYVSQVETPADAQALAADMVVFVAAQLPAASTTIVLDPTLSDQAGNALTPAFLAALLNRGFAVADEGQTGASGTHHIRYLVTALDNGDLVRLSIDEVACRPAARSWCGKWRRRGDERCMDASARRT